MGRRVIERSTNYTVMKLTILLSLLMHSNARSLSPWKNYLVNSNAIKTRSGASQAFLDPEQKSWAEYKAKRGGFFKFDPANIVLDNPGISLYKRTSTDESKVSELFALMNQLFSFRDAQQSS